MSNTLAIVEKAGNLTIAEEDVLRSRLEEMEEALEKEQANERAIEEKIKVGNYRYVAVVHSLDVGKQQADGNNMRTHSRTGKCCHGVALAARSTRKNKRRS